MFSVNTVLENCWEYNIRNRGVVEQTFAYENKQVFFGDNKIDKIGYDYNNIGFDYNFDDFKFYITNNCLETNKINFKIFDYYTDLCVLNVEDFGFDKGVTYWMVPPFYKSLTNCKNGFYLEVYFLDKIIRKNIFVKDFDSKHPMSNKFKNIKSHEVNFNELCDSESIYKEFEINLDEIETYLDMVTKNGIRSTPFIERNKKVTLVTNDKYIDSINSNFSFTNKIKVVNSVNHLELISNLNEKIDLVRIDIYGSEYDLFENMESNTLNNFHKFIIDFKNNKDFRIMNIIEKLTTNGFKFKFKEDGYPIENQSGLIYAWK